MILDVYVVPFFSPRSGGGEFNKSRQFNYYTSSNITLIVPTYLIQQAVI